VAAPVLRIPSNECKYLYQASAALNANSRWQEVISENLASSSVPGFKKQELSVAAVQAGLLPPAALIRPTAPNFSACRTPPPPTSFVSGDFQFTGNKNDMAIEGQGFFQVRLPNGSFASTRNGEFQLNPKGQLITKEGYAVMGHGRSHPIGPEQCDPISHCLHWRSQPGRQPRRQTENQRVNNPALLTQISGGYFIAGNQSQSPPQRRPRHLHRAPGYIETSNTSVVREMANMMTPCACSRPTSTSSRSRTTASQGHQRTRRHQLG